MGLSPTRCCGDPADQGCCETVVNREGQGDLLRDAGMHQALAAASPEWRAAADKAVQALIRTRDRFTAEDVRKIAGDPPTPNALGALLHEWAHRGAIRAVGTRKATRTDRRSGRITVWVAA